MSESFLDGRVIMHAGDCLDVLAGLEACSIDACVTDPPYHLTSIVKRFGSETAAPAKFKTGPYGGGFDPEGTGTGAAFARMSRGFMGKQWDGGDIAFRPELWAEVLRVLKPGAHLLAFGGTRTYHRMACAIEDAGFEIRDCIQWLYGSGFPKSHDVSKGIDRSVGAKRKRIGTKVELGVIHGQGDANNTMHEGWQRPWRDNPDADAHFVTIPTTVAARQWEGWGTALKPACEPIVLARKPLSEPTVAANVLKWGTGALNIDGCRVKLDGEDTRRKPVPSAGCCIASPTSGSMDDSALAGRWPANVIHDGSEEVVGAFPEIISGSESQPRGTGGIWSDISNTPCGPQYGDSGSAARFFYTAKADSDDRLGSKHPTVKPLDLMQYLVRLVTPPKGLVIDPFAGTGTTGEAAFREGMRAVLIEREAEYQADIRRRMALVLGGPVERANAAIKQRMKDKPADHGPLFASSWDEMWQKPFDFSQEPV